FCIFTIGRAVTASISGLSIRNGDGDFVGIGGAGGVTNTGIQLTLNNVIVSGNIESGIENDSNCRLIIQNSTIMNNSTVTRNAGGGILNEGDLELRNTAVTLNASTEFGGGIFNSGGRVQTQGTVKITSNFAGKHGGGIYNESSIPNGAVGNLILS